MIFGSCICTVKIHILDFSTRMLVIITWLTVCTLSLSLCLLRLVFSQEATRSYAFIVVTEVLVQKASRGLFT